MTGKSHQNSLEVIRSNTCQQTCTMPTDRLALIDFVDLHTCPAQFCGQRHEEALCRKLSFITPISLITFSLPWSTLKPPSSIHMITLYFQILSQQIPLDQVTGHIQGSLCLIRDALYLQQSRQQCICQQQSLHLDESISVSSALPPTHRIPAATCACCIQRCITSLQHPLPFVRQPTLSSWLNRQYHN